MINIESIKGKIRSLAEKKNLKSQEVLQIYSGLLEPSKHLKKCSITKRCFDSEFT